MKIIKSLRSRIRVISAFLVASAVIFTTMQLSAHHSVSGQFDVSKQVIVTGTVEKVNWVNPHIYVQVKAKDDGGDVVWNFGTVPVAMARKAGITKQSLYGDGKPVTITAFPARDGTQHLGFLTRIEYADGTYVSVNPDRL